MTKLSSIKTVLLNWLRQNLEKIFLVLIVLLALMYALQKFQDLIDDQRSIVDQIDRQNEIHKIELERVHEAYIAERKALEENARLYKERIAEIQKEYEQETLEHEENKEAIATAIVEQSGGDPAKIAEAVSEVTGFMNESRTQ